MSLFRRRPKPVPGPPIDLRKPPPDPSDDAVIRAEWTSLETPEAAREGWANGMALFDQGPPPGQLINVAEYLSRGLAYTYVAEPQIDDAQAVEAVRRILRVADAVDGPEFLRGMAGKFARLALAVARQKGWQPVELGGDGQVTDEILGAGRDGIVWGSVAAPGVGRDDVMRHFFGEAA